MSTWREDSVHGILHSCDDEIAVRANVGGIHEIQATAVGELRWIDPGISRVQHGPLDPAAFQRVSRRVLQNEDVPMRIVVVCALGSGEVEIPPAAARASRRAIAS